MNQAGTVFRKPNLLEQILNKGFGAWVRNAEAAGEVVLKKGTNEQKFRIRVVPDKEKPEVVKAYLDRFKFTVQRYFRSKHTGKRVR